MHMGRLRDTAALLLGLLVAGVPAVAHETDQYSVPTGRAYADLRFEFSRELYDLLDLAVERTNARITATLDEVGQATEATARFHRPEHVARAVWAAFPLRVMYVEFTEAWLRSPEMRERYPGLLTIYAPPSWIYAHWALVIDPTKLPRQVRCSTIMVNGVHFGTDKLMHLVHLGHFYYDTYALARRAGMDETAAMQRAVSVGTGLHPILSEETWLGLLSTGVRSNADLAVNYTGLKFFRNLTEPMSFKGEIQPPLLVREGHFWRLNDHVRPGRDIFSIYVSAHWDEALLPNTYAPGVAGFIQDEVVRRCPAVVDWYRDGQGRVRTRADFLAIVERLSTYYGEEYGYKGAFDEVVGIANCCFDDAAGVEVLPAAGDGGGLGSDGASADGAGVGGADVDGSDASGPDALGRTPLWWAARRGDAERVGALLDAGAEVGAADVDGETPLHAAVRGGSRSCVAALVGHGAAIDAANCLGVTPLHLAIRLDQAEIALALLDAGAEVNAVDVFGCTPLHDAGDRGDRALFAELRRRGGDVGAASHGGRRPALARARAGDGARSSSANREARP